MTDVLGKSRTEGKEETIPLTIKDLDSIRRGGHVYSLTLAGPERVCVGMIGTPMTQEELEDFGPCRVIKLSYTDINRIIGTGLHSVQSEDDLLTHFVLQEAPQEKISDAKRTKSHAHLKGLIESEEYHVFAAARTVVCCIKTNNGSVFIGYALHAQIGSMEFDFGPAADSAYFYALEKLEEMEKYKSLDPGDGTPGDGIPLVQDSYLKGLIDSEEYYMIGESEESFCCRITLKNGEIAFGWGSGQEQAYDNALEKIRKLEIDRLRGKVDKE